MRGRSRTMRPRLLLASGAVLAVVVLVLALRNDGTTPVATLRVVVHPEGPEAPSRQHTITCRNRRGPTCSRLAALDTADFARLPRAAICTEIYGGPDTARIDGTLHGEEVHAELDRHNGCAIDRWDRFAWLLEPR